MFLSKDNICLADNNQQQQWFFSQIYWPLLVLLWLDDSKIRREEQKQLKVAAQGGPFPSGWDTDSHVFAAVICHVPGVPWWHLQATLI